MATYSEFKALIGRIFGYRLIGENEEENIQASIRNRYPWMEGSNPINFVIEDSELREIYDRTIELQNENLELYSAQSYEVAVDFNYFLRRMNHPLISNDTTNEIVYTLGFPSVEYCAFLIMSIIDINDKLHKRHGSVPTRFFRADYFGDNVKKFSLSELLPRIMGVLSLKIETPARKSLVALRKLKTSFYFQFMYRTNFALVEFPNIEEMFHLNRTVREQIDFDKLDTPPLREYVSDVVDYYKLALSSADAYTKYISFYHVMEYFYDEVFKKKMVNDLRERITNPGFSYKDDDKIYDMALFVKNRLRMNDELGQGNELESLKFVLNEYIVIEDLKQRIAAIDPEALDYYKTMKVEFCNAPTIPWEDLAGIYTQMARRIYYTRNSLVHSKSGKNKERYKPYADEGKLQKEIPLVKAVAELIIINSSPVI